MTKTNQYKVCPKRFDHCKKKNEVKCGTPNISDRNFRTKVYMYSNYLQVRNLYYYHM